MAKLKITKLQAPPSFSCASTCSVPRSPQAPDARAPDAPLPFPFLVTFRQAGRYVQTITMFPTASKLTVFGEARNDHEFHKEPNTFCCLSLFHPPGILLALAVNYDL